jgi:hypothetical protein
LRGEHPTNLQVQLHELIPSVTLGVMHSILSIDPTNIGSVDIDRAVLAVFAEMSTHPVASIEKSGLLG